MTPQNDGRNDSADGVVDLTLRRRAEEKARATGDQDLEALWPEEARRLLHELRVHQIELEMQNEELRRTQGSWKSRGSGTSTCMIWRRLGISRSANEG